MSEQTSTSANATLRDLVVIGGGISGLTLAWRLARAGADVQLLEAGEIVGGAMQTERRDGFLLEKGPFNVMIRSKEFEAIVDGLGNRIKVVAAAEEAHNRYIYRHGRLCTVPTGPAGLFTSELLSKRGALRAARGLFLSARGRRDDTTLGEFAVRRFGVEVADSIVSAAISGILAGDIDKLSAYASFPVLEDFDRKSISPLGRTIRRIPNMIRRRRDPSLRRKWKGLVSIDCGLGGLCAAVADELGERCVTGCRVERLVRDETGFTLACRRGGLAEEVRCRRVVVATPLETAAELIEPLAPNAAREMKTIESASLAVINVGFKKSDVGHPLDGFGFLAPRNEPDFPLMGVLWADSAFPHHAPPNRRLLRCFLGGDRTPDVLERNRDDLLEVACDTVRDVLNVRGEPSLVDVCSYPNALPQYHLGHREKIARIRRHVAAVPGLTLAGNYLEGVSINDCVKLSSHTADTLSGNATADVPI